MSTPPQDPTGRGTQGQQRVGPDGPSTGSGQKDARTTAAENLEKLAGSAKAAATQLERDDVGHISQYVSDLAEGMTRFSGSLREKSGDEILRDVSRLARENPALFVTGSVAIGFALTRFARASSSDAELSDQRDAGAEPYRTTATPSAQPGSSVRTAGAGSPTGATSFDDADRMPGSDPHRPGTPRGGIH